MDRIIEEHRKELERLCTRNRVRRLEVFDSAVTGRFDPGSSDLDFLVELEPGSPGELADRYLGLLTELEEELFGRSVDLLMPAAVRNPYFLQQIESSRTLLYAA
jgi:predicted nucleotidyltransferase